MEIRQIQYFLSIAKTGSFSAAADEQFISQSSLSKKIISLEEELGVILFDRSKLHICLTETGEVFLEHAQKLDTAYRTMIADLERSKSNVDILSIAAIPVMPQYGITTQIAQFRDQFPNIKFSLEEIEDVNILPALDEYRIDLAFKRHNYLDLDKYECLEFYRDKLLVVVSKKNRHAIRTSISLDQLSGDTFIMFDKVTTLHTLIMEECRKAGFTPTIFHSSLRYESIFGLTGLDVGLSLMPVKVYEYYQHPDVLAIPLDEDIECNIVLVYLKNRKLPQAASTFIKFIERNAII